ncbi:hypothetical protein DFA_03615 [Cavenderia fasciculata]|uniref:Uncharacterized protein n=1 Tax=Cavenderia fasciculata TaxID=261658 RepID=F4PID7_CACFS|nr:hypothetical protein DFA_03615 [Cavenderia fasciculata]EGG25366.1 hypothetical protein DFA_03615 [Cavenderia fasciculata]|eukprot:XP_004363217.1 hypothetical protein DFA_03615 [Cavenderia fasciculata]
MDWIGNVNICVLCLCSLHSTLFKRVAFY